MRHILLVSFVCILSFSGYTHKTNEAFFNIVQKENTVEIQVEFPWTMRNALINFNPSLENSTDKIDFENTFVKYIKANLILKDKNGNLLKYQAYQELENIGHSHQNNYLIIFKGNNLYEITNTIMFNVYDNQLNYHTVKINSKQKTFKTKSGLTHFKLNVRKKNWYFILLLLPLIYIFYAYLNKRTTVNKDV